MFLNAALTITLALLAAAVPITPPRPARPESSLSATVDHGGDGSFNREEAVRQYAQTKSKYRQNRINLQQNRKHHQHSKVIKSQKDASTVLRINGKQSLSNQNLIDLTAHTLPLRPAPKLPATNHTAQVSKPKTHRKRKTEPSIGTITIGTPPQPFQLEFDSKLLDSVASPLCAHSPFQIQLRQPILGLPLLLPTSLPS